MEWLKDGGPVIKQKKDKARIKMDWDLRTDLSYLEIKNITVADAGQYTAVIFNDKGRETANVEVIVKQEKEAVKVEEKKEALLIVEEKPKPKTEAPVAAQVEGEEESEVEFSSGEEEEPMTKIPEKKPVVEVQVGPLPVKQAEPVKPKESVRKPVEELSIASTCEAEITEEEFVTEDEETEEEEEESAEGQSLQVVQMHEKQVPKKKKKIIQLQAAESTSVTFKKTQQVQLTEQTIEETAVLTEAQHTAKQKEPTSKPVEAVAQKKVEPITEPVKIMSEEEEEESEVEFTSEEEEVTAKVTEKKPVIQPQMEPKPEAPLPVKQAEPVKPKESVTKPAEELSIATTSEEEITEEELETEDEETEEEEELATEGQTVQVVQCQDNQVPKKKKIIQLQATESTSVTYKKTKQVQLTEEIMEETAMLTEAERAAKKAEGTITVDEQTTPAIRGGQAPVFTLLPSPSCIKVGETFALKCRVSGMRARIKLVASWLVHF